jgi:hypothetical protein
MVVTVAVLIVAIAIIVTIAITVVPVAVAIVPGTIAVVILAVTILPGLTTVASVALVVDIAIAILPVIPALLLGESSAAEPQRQQCHRYDPSAAFHLALQILACVLLSRLDEGSAAGHVTIRQGSVKCCKERMVWL